MDTAPTRVRTKAWLATFSLSTVLASLVWALSPQLTGHKEPWDAPNYYYPIALVVAGLFAGLLGSRRKSAYYLGAISGQLLFALIFVKAGPLLLVGVAFMAIYSVAFYIAALLSEYLRQRFVGSTSHNS